MVERQVPGSKARWGVSGVPQNARICNCSRIPRVLPSSLFSHSFALSATRPSLTDVPLSSSFARASLSSFVSSPSLLSAILRPNLSHRGAEILYQQPRTYEVPPIEQRNIGSGLSTSLYEHRAVNTRQNTNGHRRD